MMDHQTYRILSYLQERRQGMVDLLQRMALAESPSDNPAALALVLAMLKSELEQCGMSVRLFPGRVSAGMLVAGPEKGSVPLRTKGLPSFQLGATDVRLPLQLLVGHCDTVWPVGTVQQMPVRVEGETVLGPGVLDMKAGLVQMLYALRAVKDLGLRPPADSVIVINSDEEVGSRDSTPLIGRLARCAVLDDALHEDQEDRPGR
jgi:glutamate carboxypeptidase